MNNNNSENLRKWLYCDLRYVISHVVTVDDLRTFHGTTLGSLLKRKLVVRDGNRLVATDKGREAAKEYSAGAPNYRQHEAELSETVRALLHIRGMNAMKAAS